MAQDYTEVYAWGSDSYGQLGISTQGVGKNYTKPKFCSFNIVIRQISCGEEHTAMITSIFMLNIFFEDEGFVYSMGNNLNGRLGIGEKAGTHSSVPCLIENLQSYTIIKISCGWTHSAAISGIFINSQ